MKAKSIAWSVIVGVTLLALLVLSVGMPQAGTAAPMAAPTPASVTRPGSGEAPEFPVFFNSLSITADTRSSCFEVPEYSTVDLQYAIDQSSNNTMTVKLQFTNDLVTFVDGVAIVTDNAADATGMQQYQLFGRHTCVYADVITSTFPVTLTVIGVVK